ncbi:MAG: M20/M25/M40 family metallo-hydrolase [Firmicutes bacterium]|nr:M20/M25/M40 family metallo-hydrolase [Bacillota bacterium]
MHTEKLSQEEYINGAQDELKQLIRDLCAVPAPSNHEEKRAEFCKRWFDENLGSGAFVDEALNVVFPYNVTEDNDVAVLMAHTDTVFPDTEPMPFSEEGGIMRCPGITDDTSNLAVLMICARFIVKNALPTGTGVLFVANSGEEGLGNLKGCRAIVGRYGSRMKELVTLDGSDLDYIVTSAVGSHRYRVSAKTEGGHSFSCFGRRNAIQVLAELVTELYKVKVPVEGESRTTYNVGAISGGTSVNTIAQDAEMLYEYRSDDRRCLEQMKQTFEAIVKECTPDDAEVTVELIGERPCTGDVDKAAMADLVERGAAAVRSAAGKEAILTSASTDCNIPLAAGIPAICLGVAVGGGCHTREEWLDTESLAAGCRLFMEFFNYYCVQQDKQ